MCVKHLPIRLGRRTPFFGGGGSHCLQAKGFVITELTELTDYQPFSHIPHLSTRAQGATRGRRAPPHPHTAAWKAAAPRARPHIQPQCAWPGLFDCGVKGWEDFNGRCSTGCSKRRSTAKEARRQRHTAHALQNLRCKRLNPASPPRSRVQALAARRAGWIASQHKRSESSSLLGPFLRRLCE